MTRYQLPSRLPGALERSQKQGAGFHVKSCCPSISEELGSSCTFALSPHFLLCPMTLSCPPLPCPLLLGFPKKNGACLFPCPQCSITSPFLLSLFPPIFPPGQNCPLSLSSVCVSPPKELLVPPVLLSANKCTQAAACLPVPSARPPSHWILRFYSSLPDICLLALFTCFALSS